MATLCYSGCGAGEVTGVFIAAGLLSLSATWIVASATMDQALFWNSLILSLTVGLIAAYPVNVLLIKFGVKGGMGEPRNTSASHQH